MEQRAYEYFAKIDELGGMVEAVKRNYPQREIADAAFTLQQEIDAGERVVVGVNRYVAEDEEPIPTLRIDPALERKQLGRLQAARAKRDGAAVEARAGRPARGRRARGSQPDGAAARTAPARTPREGEIIESLQQVFGDYTETPVF